LLLQRCGRGDDALTLNAAPGSLLVNSARNREPADAATTANGAPAMIENGSTVTET
jgi:hypothetical protein